MRHCPSSACLFQQDCHQVETLLIFSRGKVLTLVDEATVEGWHSSSRTSYEESTLLR